ncbi:MAG TPA: enolase C-terminal domain-like protein [Thermomicrobiales bacterium]|nr:enolase C-terminal domain-like protein [Thermomicrobiales bacterium]
MKIVDVKAYVVEEPVPHQFIWRKGLPGSGVTSTTTWIRVITDEGIDGWSPIARGAITLDLLRRRVRDAIIGKNPLQKELLWHEIWELDRIEEFPMYFLGAIDVALWDITAKAANLPLYQLLGGYRDKIAVYASTVTFDSIDEYLDVADQCLDYGFTAIKLHAWGDARRDAELGQALRKHVGDDIALMYDGSAGFNPYESLYLGRALQDAGFYWYEEPMREFSIGAYRQLCEDLLIPVLSGETSDGAHYNIADFIRHNAADMVRTSVHYKGGITGAMRVAHLADAFQMTAEVHGGGKANLHVCLAIRNNSYYESLITCNPIDVEKGIDREGNIHAPEGCGVGFEVDLKDLEKRAIATL